ncbi:MAG: cytochrome P450, partial [Candidatus Limnocylindrales bacterium]
MTAPVSPSTLDSMLVDPAFIEDPYPAYALLREHAPVHESDAWGSWLLTRYDDCAAVLRDPVRFSSAGRVSAMLDQLPASERARFAPLNANFRLGMPNSDPPEHTRIRALVTRAFSPRVVEEMRPAITAAVSELLAPVVAL